MGYLTHVTTMTSEETGNSSRLTWEPYFVTVRITGSTYRLLQEERSILWEVLVSVIVRQDSYEDMSNSEWSPR